ELLEDRFDPPPQLVGDLPDRAQRLAPCLLASHGGGSCGDGALRPYPLQALPRNRHSTGSWIVSKFALALTTSQSGCSRLKDYDSTNFRDAHRDLGRARDWQDEGVADRRRAVSEPGPAAHVDPEERRRPTQPDVCLSDGGKRKVRPWLK